MSESFEAFMARAWADHADHAEAVAERLRTETPAPTQPPQLAALARLVVHLLGEHLGRFDDARWRLDALTTHPLADADVQSVLRSSRAALDLAAAAPSTPTGGFTAVEWVRAESNAAAICVGRGQADRALALIASARARLAALPDAAPADHRPLAVACHNMTWTLIERGASRTTAESQAMLELAAASKQHWSRAGTWLEVERGDYDLARAHLAAGSLEVALHHAAQCLAACLAHDAPAYERFFGHEAIALVQHARGDTAAREHHVQAAEAEFAQLDADDQAASRSSLDALRALSA